MSVIDTVATQNRFCVLRVPLVEKDGDDENDNIDTKINSNSSWHQVLVCYQSFCFLDQNNTM